MMLTDFAEEDKVRLALGMYALHMTVQHCRHSSQAGDVDIMALLRMFMFRAANGSRARSLLHS